MSDASGHSCGLMGLSREKSGRIIHATTSEEGVGRITELDKFRGVVVEPPSKPTSLDLEMEPKRLLSWLPEAEKRVSYRTVSCTPD